MRKIYTHILALLMLSPGISFAQHTFTNGANTLEISGYLIAFYQYRMPNPATPPSSDLHNSTFQLDDARFNLKGYAHGRIKYEIEMNFVDIMTIAFGGTAAIKHLPLTEANVSYINPYVNVKVGYFKVPFSSSSLVDKVPSPFMQRTLIADGDYFTRRDAGILLSHDFWHQRVSVTAGVISGMGEAIILGKGDPNGMPEEVARIQLSNAHYRDEEFDTRNLSKPLFRIVADFRYSNKTQYMGTGLPLTDKTDLANHGNFDTTAPWANQPVRNINGQKYSYGIEAAFMWHGFSAQFERNVGIMKPHEYLTDATTKDNLYAYLQHKFNTNYFKNGGYLIQANYFNRKLWSGVAVRYTEFQPFDLAEGQEQRTMSFSYNFFMKPYNLTIKLHYDYRFNLPSSGVKWNNDQFRGGVQYVF